MELTFAKREMLNALSLLVRVADAKSAMPMLSNVLLKSDGGDKVHMFATDLYLSLAGSVTTTKAKAGSCALPAKDFLERVKNMPDGPLTLVVDGVKATLKGEGKARKFTLHALPGQDYPPIPEAGDSASVKLPTKVLASLIDQTHGAISTDDTRQHIASLLVEWDGTTIRAVGTDGHRLHLAEASTGESVGNQTMLIPRKGVGELRRLCDSADEVTLTRNGSTAFFATDMTLGIKLVDAQFPPYAQVIPKTWANEIKVNASQLKEVLRAVAVSANERTGGVELSFAPGSTITVKATDPTRGSSEDTLESETEWTGKPLRVGVSAVYLMAACDAIGDRVATFGAGGDLDPMILVNESGKFVVMPMRV